MKFNPAFKWLIVLSHNPTGIRPHKTGHHILINDLYFFFAVALRPNAGHGLLILEVF